MISWLAFTKLADTNFTLPLAALLAIWLACAREWKSAFWWCLLFGFGLLIVAATKIAYVGWGIGIASVDFKGFSGHAMRAATIAPPLIYILLQRQTQQIRLAGLLCAIGFSIAICISRLVLGAHSVSEAISGLLFGLLISFCFIWTCSQRPATTFDRRLLIAGLILLLPLVSMEPAPTESWIQRVAVALAGSEHTNDIIQRMRGH